MRTDFDRIRLQLLAVVFAAALWTATPGIRDFKRPVRVDAHIAGHFVQANVKLINAVWAQIPFDHTVIQFKEQFVCARIR